MQLLDDVSKYLLLLAVFHIAFFYECYRNLFKMCTSELVNLIFWHWLWLGKTKNPFKGPYFKYPACLPVLSTFYPWHFVSAKISKYLSVDSAFKILSGGMLIHYLLMSVLAFFMFHQWYKSPIALFGSLTLTYMAYSIKLTHPMTIYTLTWIPGMFIQGWMGAISFGMALLGGYYPVLVYIVPIAAINNPSCLWGLILGLPQLIPFLWYYPKSVRWGQMVDYSMGKLKLSNFLDLIVPTSRTPQNGLLPYEYNMTIGLIPLLLIPFSTSRIWIFALIYFAGMLGAWKSPFRIQARMIYAFSFSLIWMACSGLNNLHLGDSQIFSLVLIQAFFLLGNLHHRLGFPYTEWSRKPSEFIRRYEWGSLKFPFVTGIYWNEHTSGYRGGFALK